MSNHRKNSRKDLEEHMRYALRYIATTGDLPPLDDKTKFALKECQDAGYIEGLLVNVMSTGRIVIEHSCPRVKLAGLRFAYPYRDWRFVLPVLIAIAELVVIIIQTIQNAGG